MKRKIHLLISLLFICFKFSFSQGCPPNLDFEFGNFNNWDCFIGQTDVVSGKNVITLNPSPPTSGRHEIISSTTDKDPYGNFPQLCPYGSSYSVKLGNNQNGAEAEGVSYSFTIPTTIDTFTFTYFYAVVFQNPGHAIYEQPRFFVTAYEVATGNIINCASYDYVSTGSLPGFQHAGSDTSILFRDWTPASLQFAGLGGKLVRLEFRTADCTLGGHFGYAYLDVASGCTNILATAPYCIETNSLLLNAPYGFQSYTWYNSTYTTVVGNQQSITLSPPPATSGVFYVDAIPYPGYGCRDTFQAIIKTLPVPDTPVAKSDYKFCQYDSPQKLTADKSPNCDLLWYSTATGGNGSDVAPSPSTSKSGVFYYYVSQKVLFGCESFRKKITITILPTPNTAFSVNQLRQCQNGNLFSFTSTTTNTTNCIYTWKFGDGNSLSSKIDSVSNHHYTTSGDFDVVFRAENDSTCFQEKTTRITVVPKPISDFSYPSPICQNQTLVKLSDKSYVQGNVAQIDKWWWNVDGIVTQNQFLQSFTPINSGVLNIKFAVVTKEGCVSDTNYKILNIYSQPSAMFELSKPLCNNEFVNFKDFSTIPTATASEALNKWYWNFNGLSSSSLQNPAFLFKDGINFTKLIAESNFGCKSLEFDSNFIIYPKPMIKLSINDSCVFKAIKYTPIDLLGTVANWSWNFGAGYYINNTPITKSYINAGDNSFVLIGETVHNCKDTIIRPFRIYDNIANAGRDTIAAKGEPIQLNANGYPNQTYLWTPPRGLDSDTIVNPIATFDYEQLYRLHSITKEGCENDSKILIKRFAGPELYLPTGFSPNSDKLNDVLKVFPVGIKEFHFFKIYNRLGEMLFSTTDWNIGWDGTYNGKPSDVGVYVAIAQAVDYKGNPMLVKQTVTLIR